MTRYGKLISRLLFTAVVLCAFLAAANCRAEIGPAVATSILSIEKHSDESSGDSTVYTATLAWTVQSKKTLDSFYIVYAGGSEGDTGDGDNDMTNFGFTHTYLFADATYLSAGFNYVSSAPGRKNYPYVILNKNFYKGDSGNHYRMFGGWSGSREEGEGTVYYAGTAYNMKSGGGGGIGLEYRYIYVRHGNSYDSYRARYTHPVGDSRKIELEYELLKPKTVASDLTDDSDSILRFSLITSH